MNKFWLLLVVVVLLASCKTRKVPTKKNTTSNTERVIKRTVENPKPSETKPLETKVYANATERYIDTFKDIAKMEMQLYDIPASITLAQGILESGSGNGRLSVEANNHFGIKCHGWTGAKIYHDDDRSQECFRKYVDAKYSFRDHSLFLTERKRYANLFKLKAGDYKGWARGLKAAGYATDRKYPDKLISLIERYDLHKYDEEVLGTAYEPIDYAKEESIHNTVHTVVKGDTLYSISKRYNTTVQNIQQLNGLNGTNISIGQELIISKY
ncbi:glucosaminidase domain-containing protein [Aestuariibaculum sediminum]|uniref:Peptidoglycan hydrolase n=1 Tax=Aestuariibaculum sediminum TaxID=2770637 RepID=A0A8J6Q3G6_9FLAO|nr:glucosaminidase domain-containing protein [Aestuariibaculum sediminum]MBD0833621.1 glucosaminidase domain-containing protein [Aestuariibaculum sediminum]